MLREAGNTMPQQLPVDHQISNQHTLLRKHNSRLSIFGVRRIDLVENVLWLSLLVGNVVFRRVISAEASL